MYWCELETATEREETNVLLAKHHKLGTTKDKLESFIVGRCVIEDETITRKISAIYTICYKTFLHSITETNVVEC